MTVLSGKKIKEKNGSSVKLDEKTYVVLFIGGKIFGIDVERINSVNGMMEMRDIPNSKAYMKGVINLRDRIIPVIDLRIKFEPDMSVSSDKPVIIITLIKGKYIGLIVDLVHDVVTIPVTEIQNTPHFSENIDQDCIDGICTINEQSMVLINVDRVLSDDEFDDMQEENVE